jgi:cyclic pyranopterin phosphate synthase
MPEAGLRFLPAPDLLTAAEIEQVARAAVAVGFRKFRLTGGEPTLRADLVEIVTRIAQIPGVGDLSMTTNAILLPRLAVELRATGLRRVNVHLDSLDPERVARVMRWGSFADIWAGIEAAEAAGLAPIKLNAVLVRGFNEDDAVPLAALTREHPWHVRFIETMPFGTGETQAVARTGLVRSAQTRAQIEAALGPLTRSPAATRRTRRELSFAEGAWRRRVHQPGLGALRGTCNRIAPHGRPLPPLLAQR